MSNLPPSDYRRYRIISSDDKNTSDCLYAAKFALTFFRFFARFMQVVIAMYINSDVAHDNEAADYTNKVVWFIATFMFACQIVTDYHANAFMAFLQCKTEQVPIAIERLNSFAVNDVMPRQYRVFALMAESAFTIREFCLVVGADKIDSGLWQQYMGHRFMMSSLLYFIVWWESNREYGLSDYIPISKTIRVKLQQACRLFFRLGDRRFFVQHGLQNTVPGVRPFPHIGEGQLSDEQLWHASDEYRALRYNSFKGLGYILALLCIADIGNAQDADRGFTSLLLAYICFFVGVTLDLLASSSEAMGPFEYGGNTLWLLVKDRRQTPQSKLSG